MPDPLAGTAPDDASAVAPVAPETDIEKIIEERISARIAGFQRLVSAREEEALALRRELDDERLASLPEDERASITEERKDKRIRELEAQVELNQLAGSYGEEMPYFTRLLSGESAEDQLKVMREYATARLAQANPAPVIVPDPVVDVPGVDLNRPLRPSQGEGTRLPDGTLMTEADADRILGAMTGPMASITQQRLRPSD